MLYKLKCIPIDDAALLIVYWQDNDHLIKYMTKFLGSGEKNEFKKNLPLDMLRERFEGNIIGQGCLLKRGESYYVYYPVLTGDSVSIKGTPVSENILEHWEYNSPRRTGKKRDLDAKTRNKHIEKRIEGTTVHSFAPFFESSRTHSTTESHNDDSSSDGYNSDTTHKPKKSPEAQSTNLELLAGGFRRTRNAVLGLAGFAGNVAGTALNKITGANSSPLIKLKLCNPKNTTFAPCFPKYILDIHNSDYLDPAVIAIIEYHTQIYPEMFRGQLVSTTKYLKMFQDQAGTIDDTELNFQGFETYVDATSVERSKANFTWNKTTLGYIGRCMEYCKTLQKKLDTNIELGSEKIALYLFVSVLTAHFLSLSQNQTTNNDGVFKKEMRKHGIKDGLVHQYAYLYNFLVKYQASK